MGRLLDRLLCDSQHAPAATPATLATLRAGSVGKVAESQESQGADVEKTQVMRAHLLTLAESEGIDPAHVHRLHDDDLRAIPADYAEHNLTAYLRALERDTGMDAGMVPWDWQAVAQCDGCGPVHLWEPLRVKACPWCFKRKAGKSIPRPLVKCGDCIHYVPDPLNPAAGVGTCGVGCSVRWPMQVHRCEAMRQRSIGAIGD